MLFLKFEVMLDETKEVITIFRSNSMRLCVGDKVDTLDGEGTILKILF